MKNSNQYLSEIKELRNEINEYKEERDIFETEFAELCAKYGVKESDGWFHPVAGARREDYDMANYMVCRINWLNREIGCMERKIERLLEAYKVIDDCAHYIHNSEPEEICDEIECRILHNGFIYGFKL